MSPNSIATHSSSSYRRATNPLLALINVASSILESEGHNANETTRANTTITPTCNRPSTPPSSSSSSSIPTVSPAGSVNPQERAGGVEKLKRSFAMDLMDLLDDESFVYLSWMPDGKAFTIVNSKLFTKEEMPKHFNMRNMSSFVRKLTRWGFTRSHEAVTMNSDIFKHPCFLQGRRDLVSSIQPNRKSVACGASASDPSTASARKEATAYRPISTSPTPPCLPAPSSVTSTKTRPMPIKMAPRPSTLSFQQEATHRLLQHQFLAQQQATTSWWRARAIASAATNSGFSVYPMSVSSSGSKNSPSLKTK